MRKLSTGTHVENQMKLLALQYNYEQQIVSPSLNIVSNHTFYFSPCHSSIFDSSDKCWKDYFTKVVKYQKSRHTNNIKKLLPLPTPLKDYLHSLLGYSSNGSDNILYDNMTQQPIFHPTKDEATIEWAQSSIINITKLFMGKHIKITVDGTQPCLDVFSPS